MLLEERLDNLIKQSFGLLPNSDIEKYNQHRNDGCEPMPFVDINFLQWTEQESSGIDLQRYFYNKERRLYVAAFAEWEKLGYGLLIWEVGKEENSLFISTDKGGEIIVHWASSCGRIELNITKAQAARGAHPGPCDNDIVALRTVPAIRRQLAKLNPAHVAAYLQEFGAWDAADLADHDANLDRLLWIACRDINEQTHN